MVYDHGRTDARTDTSDMPKTECLVHRSNGSGIIKNQILTLLFGKYVFDTKLASDRYAERCSDALTEQNNAERLG